MDDQDQAVRPPPAARRARRLQGPTRTVRGERAPGDARRPDSVMRRSRHPAPRQRRWPARLAADRGSLNRPRRATWWSRVYRFPGGGHAGLAQRLAPPCGRLAGPRAVRRQGRWKSGGVSIVSPDCPGAASPGAVPVLAARYDATSAATASGHLLVRRPSACLHAELATASSGRRWPASRILAPYAGRHVRKRGAWMRGAR